MADVEFDDALHMASLAKSAQEIEGSWQLHEVEADQSVRCDQLLIGADLSCCEVFGLTTIADTLRHCRVTLPLLWLILDRNFAERRGSLR